MGPWQSRLPACLPLLLKPQSRQGGAKPGLGWMESGEMDTLDVHSAAPPTAGSRKTFVVMRKQPDQEEELGTGTRKHVATAARWDRSKCAHIF